MHASLAGIALAALSIAGVAFAILAVGYLAYRARLVREAIAAQPPPPPLPDYAAQLARLRNETQAAMRTAGQHLESVRDAFKQGIRG